MKRNFYAAIYEWEHWLLSVQPEVNPYSVFNNFQHNQFTLLQNKVLNCYQLYPAVDELFICDSDRLLQNNSRFIVGNLNKPHFNAQKARLHIVGPVTTKHAMTPHRLESMECLTVIFVHVYLSL